MRSAHPPRKQYKSYRSRRNQKNLAFAIILGLLIIISLIYIIFFTDIFDPHRGQVYIYDGQEWVWMTPLEGVPVNTLTASDFTETAKGPRYNGTSYTSSWGIDVSEHQYDIDWRQVADAGVEFAFIRAARRGYTEGGLFEDTYFRKNIEEATANGVKVGVYIFSQAINVQEAIEEANFVIQLLAPYRLDLPVVFDWEKIDNGDKARTDGLDPEILSNCAVAFCETIKAAGYEPCIYFNRNIGYYGFDLSRMTDYKFWFALPDFTHPSFYYAVDMWQYTFNANIPGVSTPADMNLILTPIPTVSES